MGQSKQRKKLMGKTYGKRPNPWRKPKLGICNLSTQTFTEKTFEGWEICPPDDDGNGTYKTVNTLWPDGHIGFAILRKTTPEVPA